MKKRWTVEEEEIIVSLQHKSLDDMVDKLPHRTRNSIVLKTKSLRKQGKITVDSLKRRAHCKKCHKPFYQKKGAKVSFCDDCKIHNICLHCGKRFEVIESRQKKEKFCSMDCRFSKPEYHPMHGKKHNKESIQKMSINNNLRKLKRSGKPIPKEFIKGLEKGRGWLKEKTKLDNEVLAERAIYLSKLYKGKKNPEHSKRMKKFYIEHPEKHPNRILAKTKKRTYIEQVMYDKLLEANIPFEEQFRIINYYADFALVEHKLIVECDGEYWHDPEKDSIRDKRINSEGWEVIRFTGSKICKYPDECIDELKRLIS